MSRMGFMDKVKSVASDAANQAKVATSSAQTKIEQSQLQSKMDGLAKQLGFAVYNERANGTPATGNDATIEEMKGIQAQIEALSQPAPDAAAAAPPATTPVSHTDAAPAAPAVPAAPPPATSASEPTTGDFKL
jgi:hypothetical protein